ncbi:hypothetical protein [Streptomyces genisteinicus]|uniref:Lipoprotein n=1 Tax=Streptomyces genisteinicus TaxID=2768068 RepID=A0A7H0HWL1_9ACTN|nr:hypothetical protein [Streptomyces genisteinicus]QNP64927.1 hypothetical protein IAG43_19760 [Streptomyces genisteinicus]
MRDTTVPTLLLAACALLALPACTAGGDGGADAEPPARTAAAAPAGAGLPPTREELERAALSGGDLTGFQVLSGDGLVPGGRPVADRPECRPLADAMGDRVDPRALHTVERGLGSLERLGLAVSASLGSYRPADAEEVVKGIEKALAVCGGGFRATLDGRIAAYGSVRRVPFPVRGADEAVGWTTVSTSGGHDTALHLVVVRDGAAVVRFMAVDLARAEPAEVPRQVVDAQLAGLSRALAG